MQFHPRRSTVVAAFLLMLSASASAQMSGTYTIDSSLPAGGGNFVSFTAAVTAMSTAPGINGPVTFVVYNGAGPYGTFTIASSATIIGSSATNTVTFAAAPGHTPVITGTPAATAVPTVKLGGTTLTANTGPSNVSFQGLTIDTGVNTVATGNGAAAFMALGCSNITLQNCIFRGPAVAAQAAGVGCCFVICTNCAVYDSEAYNCGIQTGTGGSTAYSGAFNIYYGPTPGNRIERCKAHDCAGPGIFVGTSGSTTMPTNVVIANNFIWNCTGQTGSYPGGLALRRAGSGTIAFNSILMPAGSTYPGLHIMADAAGTAPSIVENNMVQHDGTGACVKLETTTTLVPATFDYNVYQPGATAFVGAVAATNHATLAAWQAVAAPNMAGKEVNSIQGTTGFLSSTDLHITAASSGFNNGAPVAGITVDIDGFVRNAGTPCRGADETTGVGLYPSFAVSPAVGPAALTVAFTDTTYTSAPGGVTAWAWDFNNDTVIDSNLQNPSFTYVVPGTYTVTLTATDGTFGSASITRTNVITVQPYQFQVSTVGGGVGNLDIHPIPPQYQNPTAATGYMFVSFATTSAVGTGPFFGMVPDATVFSIITAPANVGDILHWVVTPGLFPTVPLSFPAGSLSAISGVTVDFLQVDLGPAQNLLAWSAVRRVTF